MTNLRILETLEHLAASGRHPTVTMFWVKHRCAPKSESKNSRKSHEDNDKQPFGTYGPEDIVFYGPNGETE